MNSLDAIRTKRAVRQFQDQPLPPETVHLILNAGRRAQSSKNTQPWHFIAVQDRERLLKLSTLGTFAGHLAGAALAVGIITPPPETRFSVMFDAGQAAAYMQLSALDLGVGSCLATIYQPDLARQLLRFPDSLTMLIALSFGYPQEAGLLSAAPQKSGRRPFKETVHWEKW
jgi:nitroreductase